MLTVLESLPDALLDLPASALAEHLDGPCLVHLPGRNERPLFVSVLLHGNETTGWEAVQELLCKHAEAGLPRAMSVFIGNLRAAAEGLRSLPNQVDYNRVWPDANGETVRGPEAVMMAEVVEAMRQRKVFASVDIHNNTGRNPHYACITQITPAAVQLASGFSSTLLHFTRPRGVQNMAFDPLCPAVTIECGAVGSANARLAAMKFIEYCLALETIPDRWPDADSLSLYRSVATVKLPSDTSFGFGEEPVQVSFPEEMDAWNWTALPVGTAFARVDSGDGNPLDVRDADGNDVAGRYFELRGAELLTRVPVTPAMLSHDIRVIRQDCLCYLLESLPYPGEDG